jgi:hypothetical protein
MVNTFHMNNQQERLKMGWWIAGFVDGEGCFSVSFNSNSTSKSGKQIFPEFVITQGMKSLDVLEDIRTFFDCGSLVINKRHDNHREHLVKYCVRSIPDLRIHVIPFFEEFPLKTAKRNDFEIFKKIIRLMSDKKHLTESGFLKIKELAEGMNRKKIRS